MTEQPRVRLRDLTGDHVGPLMQAWRAPLVLMRTGWFSADLSSRIDRFTLNELVAMKLLERRGKHARVATLTREGNRLAELLVTVSRDIAGAVAGRGL